MVAFNEDVKHGFTVEQLAAKFRINTTKVHHRLQLLQAEPSLVPEPSYLTYHQLNEQLRNKLLESYQATKLHSMPRRFPNAPEVAEGLP